MTAVLIDLSSLAYPIWHVTQSEPDPNHASGQIVARVRALAQAHRHVAVCVDSGKSFRATIDPEYKGNRPERDERLAHQIALAVKQLEEDGFPIWGAAGFEADDLIATGVRRVLAHGGSGPEPVLNTVAIVSADKDLLQLVSDKAGVKVITPKDGFEFTDATVFEKHKVRPDQMRDFVTITGDKADNIPGIDGIGPAGAASLLKKYDTLDALYKELHDIGGKAMGFSDPTTKKLEAFELQWPTTRMLITLRDDAPISEEAFAALLAERTPKPSTHEYADEGAWEVVEDEEEPVTSTPNAAPAPKANSEPQTDAAAEEVLQAKAVAADLKPAGPQALAVRDPNELAPSPAEYERQLDPRSLRQAQALAADIHRSGFFRDYGSPYAVLSTALVGRELGLPFMTSLRTIHIIEGRHGLSAQLIMGLVLKSPLCEYLRMVELTDKSCTYAAKRSGNPEVRITHTVEMAVQAGLMKDNSNWKKFTQDMLMNRCGVRICRIVWPDIVANVASTDELKEGIS